MKMSSPLLVLDQRILPPENPTRLVQKIDFLEKALSNFLPPTIKPVTVLDLSGEDTYALALAQRGFAVTSLARGIFHEEVRNQVRQSELTVHWEKRDLAQVSYRRDFHCALALCTPACRLFDSAGTFQNALEKIDRSLKNEGVLIIDQINFGWLIQNFQSKDWQVHTDGTKTLIKRKLNYQTGIIEESRTVSENEEPGSFYQQQRQLFVCHELVRLLTNKGYRFLQSWGDFDSEEYHPINSKRCIAAFRK